MTATPTLTPSITPTPPAPPVIVVIAPVTTTTRIIAGNGIVVEFPAGTFGQTTVITMTTLANPEVPAVGAFKLFGMAFDLHAVDAQSGLPVQPLAGMSYTVSIPYDETQLNGLDESTLKLYYWNGSQWQPEPTSRVDVANNVLHATVSHFSVWAIGAGYRVYVPLALR